MTNPTVAPQSQGDSRGTLTGLEMETTYWSPHTSLVKRLQAAHLYPPHTLSTGCLTPCQTLEEVGMRPCEPATTRRAVLP